jgi:AcrR family transcriptional regulator
MRITLDTLAHTNPPMTVRESILAAIKRGVYPWVAAAAVGVSRRQFRTWLRSKERRYRQFALEIRKARGWARLQAEMTLYEKDPRSWLKAGPGREAPGSPGWTKDVSPPSKKRKRRAQPLADPAWRQLIAKMLDALQPYPEARTALARLLQEQQEKRR